MSTPASSLSIHSRPEPEVRMSQFMLLLSSALSQVISYDSLRGGVSVITEKGEVTISYLLIQNADLADSGKYSCSPSNADVASVRVHVLNGKTLILRYVNVNGELLLLIFLHGPRINACYLLLHHYATIIRGNLSALHFRQICYFGPYSPSMPTLETFSARF